MLKKDLLKELELAEQVQKELFPSNIPKIKNLDIAASLISAEAIGGDCYDFIPIDDSNLVFYVGDAIGHGVAAGLLSVINSALVPALIEQCKTTEELIIRINKILKTRTLPNVFMTLVMAQWNIPLARLEFTQAGHYPILHFKASENTIYETPTGGMALGVSNSIENKIKTHHLHMATDDLAILYTDGILDAWKDEYESFGMTRFKESIKKHSHKNAQEIHDGVLKDLQNFVKNYPQADDITLVIAKRTK